MAKLKRLFSLPGRKKAGSRRGSRQDATTDDDEYDELSTVRPRALFSFVALARSLTLWRLSRQQMMEMRKRLNELALENSKLKERVAQLEGEQQQNKNTSQQVGRLQ